MGARISELKKNQNLNLIFFFWGGGGGGVSGWGAGVSEFFFYYESIFFLGGGGVGRGGRVYEFIPHSPNLKKTHNCFLGGGVCGWGWLVGCFGFSGPMRQYFSLYRAVSQRKRRKRE